MQDEVKSKIVPMILVPPQEYDPEEQRHKKSIQEITVAFVKRVNIKWPKRHAWIDLDETIRDKKIDDGESLVKYIFRELSTDKNYVPVCWLDSSAETKNDIKTIIRNDQRGVGLRVRLENLMQPDVSSKICSLCEELGIAVEEIDFFLELGGKFEPYQSFSAALISSLSKIEDLEKFRNFCILGTSIPEVFSGDDLPRHEWLFYQTLLQNKPTDMRRPNYGDYTIVPLSFSLGLNMAVIKPAAKIVYATSKNWMVCKGKAFRDNPGQMVGLCKDIVQSGEFRGKQFSDGDNQIYLCSNDLRVNMSNLGGWKKFGINHHICQALDDLSSLHAPA